LRVLNWGLTPGLAGRLTVGRYVASTVFENSFYSHLLKKSSDHEKKRKNLIMGPEGGPETKRTGRLTVGRKVNGNELETNGRWTQPEEKISTKAV
jgi:hypothetical protein